MEGDVRTTTGEVMVEHHLAMARRGIEKVDEDRLGADGSAELALAKTKIEEAELWFGKARAALGGYGIPYDAEAASKLVIEQAWAAENEFETAEQLVDTVRKLHESTAKFLERHRQQGEAREEDPIVEITYDDDLDFDAE